jgi:hypothetical protein
VALKVPRQFREPGVVEVDVLDHGVEGDHRGDRHLFSRNFSVWRDGAVIAEVDLSWLWARGVVTTGGQTYALAYEGIPQRSFTLSTGQGSYTLRWGGRVLARARKASALCRAFAIDLAGRGLELRALSARGRRFGLIENGSQVGSIGPTGWSGRKAEIDLPDDIPLPVQVFLFWLVVVLWRQAASRGAAAASAGW